MLPALRAASVDPIRAALQQREDSRIRSNPESEPKDRRQAEYGILVQRAKSQHEITIPAFQHGH